MSGESMGRGPNPDHPNPMKLLDLEIPLPSHRVAVQHVISAMAVTLGFGSLVAVLWPLWDEPKRQALHDKIFGTVVLTGAPRKPIGQELFLP